MESTTMCECGCGREVDPPRVWGGEGERYTTLPIDGVVAVVRLGCYSVGDAGDMYERVREYRRRSRPAAELEALEFSVRERLRDGTGVRDTPAPQADSGFKVGDRVHRRIARRTPEFTGTVTGLCEELDADGGKRVYWVNDQSLRMLTPVSDLEHIAEDPKRQPEANPLRHLAEAFRSLDKVACANCRVPCSHALVVRGAGPGWCKYCDNRVRVEPGRVFASATPKEAERREVWDWDVEDVGYLP